MQTAFLIVTRRCTRSCPFCFYSTGYLSHPAGEMDTPRLLDAVERLAGMGVKKLIVTGGEPLTRGDMARLLARAGERGMARLLLTNGDLIEGDTVRAVLGAGLEAVSLSVNDTATLPPREAAVAALAGAGRVPLTAIIAFHRGNAREIPAIVAWAEDRGIDALLQPAFIPPGSKGERDLSPRHFTDEEWRVVEPALLAWAQHAGMTPYARLVLGLYGRGEPLKPRACTMGSEALVLDCDGSVYPCFHRRDLGAGSILECAAPAIGERLSAAAGAVSRAPCFGEHCISLFAGADEIDLVPAR
ncbi:MAG: radical SAM protein [Chlamydiota bacterium]